MTEDADINHELAADCLKRISDGDPEAAFDLAQFYMARVVKKDVEAMLYVIEGLARQSAALGSAESKLFLSDDWVELRAVLKKRLAREFSAPS